MPASWEAVVRNAVKEKLARNEVVAAMTVRLVRSVEIAQIAATAGFDCFYIDIEHCSFSLDTTSQICMAALGVGITPMVRVPNGSPEYVARVLEAAPSLFRMCVRPKRPAAWSPPPGSLQPETARWPVGCRSSSIARWGASTPCRRSTI